MNTNKIETTIDLTNEELFEQNQIEEPEEPEAPPVTEPPVTEATISAPARPGVIVAAMASSCPSAIPAS